MSLKAKIEAVIYASEEPVTLAQLIGLLGEEGQLELDELEANQLSLNTSSDEDEDALNAEILDPADVQDVEPQPEQVETPVQIEEGGTEQDASPATEDGATGSPAPETSEESTAAVPTAEEAATSDAKAAAAASKLRDAEQKLTARKLREYFRSILEQLIADYANGDRGLEVREVASGYRLATKPEYHDAVRGFVKSLKPPIKLTLQALETLAVIAYKQPCTAPEISEIRGVDSAGVLGSLMARKLVTTAGRKQVIGRPILYKTTKDFLLRFGLKDLAELPSIEEFEKMAGELNEAVQEEIPMEEIPNDGTPVDSKDDAEDSGPLDELNSAPEPTHVLHETPEDLINDKTVQPEGRKHEPESGAEAEPQADGTPED
jgi:segregation and condensation protein B